MAHHTIYPPTPPTTASDPPSLHSPPTTSHHSLPPSPSSPLHRPIPRPPPLPLAQQYIPEEYSTRGGLTTLDQSLFLSIDAAQNKVRACVLNHQLQVVWVEQVDLDTELPEYGTRHGVYTLGNEITCPSELRIKAVDLLLEKLALQGPEGMLGKVKAVSGAAQSSSPHFLSSTFPSLLALTTHPSSSSQRLSSLLTSSTAFSLPTPPTRNDSSATRQVKEIETAVGTAAMESEGENISIVQTPAPPSTPVGVESSREGQSNGSNHSNSIEPSSHYTSNNTPISTCTTPPPPLPDTPPRSTTSPCTVGRQLLTQRTGTILPPSSLASQLMKIRQADDLLLAADGQHEASSDWEEERGEGEASREDERTGVLERTVAVVGESTLLSSLFLGRLAPSDPSDAAFTCLFSPSTNDWDPELLAIVMGDQDPERDFFQGEQSGGERLKEMLGKVATEGGKSIGVISPYFVNRFGFSSDCLLIPFTSDILSSSLSYPFSSDDDQRPAILSLGVGGDDTLLVPCGAWKPSAEEGRSVVRHPARRSISANDVEESEWVTIISNKDAALGRSLARDVYCNGQWNVFSRLTAIVPHGGTIGLDDKYFSFFFPHGETSGANVAQGFMRYMSGARVPEFPDRKVNPRLLLESQFMSLRYRLSLLYSSLSSSSPPPPPTNLLPFPPLSPQALPTTLLLQGAPAQNPAIISLASTIFGCKAYFIDETTEMARSVVGSSVGGALGLRVTGEGGGWKTTSSALGAGYKAVWGYARERGWDWGQVAESEGQGEGEGETEGEGEGEEKEERSFSAFVRDVKAAARLDLDAGKEEMEQRGRSPRNRDREVIDFDVNFEAGEKEEEDGVRRRLEEVSVCSEDAEEEEHSEKEGLTLVASPDKEEFKFYASMLREHVRLAANARRGLI